MRNNTGNTPITLMYNLFGGDNFLINLSNLFVNNKFIISSDDIDYLKFEYGDYYDFLINPNTLTIYKRIVYKKIKYNLHRAITIEIGKLVFLKNNKLEIEPM